MSGPARAGCLIYALNLSTLAGFYETVLGMKRLHATEEIVVLQSPDMQLLVHAIPPQYAEGITISSPPEPREEAALKFFFTVPSLEVAGSQMAALGGGSLPGSWDGPGFRVRNAFDPEGNIFQLREPLE